MPGRESTTGAPRAVAGTRARPVRPPKRDAPAAEERARPKAFPDERVAKMGERGLRGIPFPERYGGG
ncbi:MAG: acyl-CoA dehydrogenase family protein, partial [Solirubrobacterales bacterium]